MRIRAIHDRSSLLEVAHRLAPERSDGPSSILELEQPAFRRELRRMLGRAELAARGAKSFAIALAMAETAIYDFNLERMRAAVFRVELRAGMLGADDSNVELLSEEVERPDPFTATRTGALLEVASWNPGRCPHHGPLELRQWKGTGGTSGSLGTHTDPVRPFPEAVEYFQSRRPLTRARWDRLQDTAKQRAFTVARAASVQSIAKIQRIAAKHIAEGKGVRDWRKAIRAEGYAWTDNYSSTVYRNAVQRSYAAGRYMHMTQAHVLAARPFWQVLAVKDVRTRPTHRAVDGMILRADDPNWRDQAPPFGHQCRCRLVARSSSWVNRNGTRSIMRIGSDSRLPDIPDKGWAGADPYQVSGGRRPTEPIPAPKPIPKTTLEPPKAKRNALKNLVKADPLEGRRPARVDPDPVKHRENLAAAFSKATPEGQAATRRALRDVVNNIGLEESKDLGKHGADMFAFKRQRRGIAATHSWNGIVSTSKERFTSAAEGARYTPEQFRMIVRGGQKWKPPAQRLRDLRTMIREEVHGHSPIAMGGYTGAGAAFEEASTELLARRAIRKHFGFEGGALRAEVDTMLGTYHAEVNALRDVALELKIDRDALEESIMATWNERGPNEFTGATAGIDALAEKLYARGARAPTSKIRRRQGGPHAGITDLIVAAMRKARRL